MDRFEQLRLLRIFLCHSSTDKPVVRDLYGRLVSDGMKPWLDEKDILPGQDWELEIRKAVQNSDIVIACLSRSSITKRGFVQKEIKLALDVADEQPEGTIFLIPLRLDDCEVPQRLRSVQWVDYFEPGGYLRLIAALKIRSDELGMLLLPQSTNKAAEQIAKIFLDDKAVRENFIKAFESLSTKEFTKSDQFIFDLYTANGEITLLSVKWHISDLHRLRDKILTFSKMNKQHRPNSKSDVLIVQSKWIVKWLMTSGFIKKDAEDIIVNESMNDTLDRLIIFLRDRKRLSIRDEMEVKAIADIIRYVQ